MTHGIDTDFLVAAGITNNGRDFEVLNCFEVVGFR